MSHCWTLANVKVRGKTAEAVCRLRSDIRRRTGPWYTEYIRCRPKVSTELLRACDMDERNSQPYRILNCRLEGRATLDVHGTDASLQIKP